MTDLMHYQLQLTLKVQTPFLSHKVGAQAFGYDMSMLKDCGGNPAFLGSLIRGNLRHNLSFFQGIVNDQSQMDELTKVLSWFGSESESESKSKSEYDKKPKRAKINFSYFWKLTDIAKSTLLANTNADIEIPRYRIGIDEQTGTVAKGNLQVIEAPVADLKLDFYGTIRANLTQEQVLLLEHWLLKAAQFTPAIGALKGTGFGKIINAELKQQPSATSETCLKVDQYQRIGVTLKFDRPFCVAKPHVVDDNRFVSEKFIAGNILIGTIAEQYPTMTKSSWFNKLRITHAFAAFPQKNSLLLQRKSSLPLSLARSDNKTVDLALKPLLNDTVYLLKNGKGQLQAPAFSSDWKDKDSKQALKDCNYPETSNQAYLTVRTRIKPGTFQAKDGALFSMECIQPVNDVWCADIDLSALTDTERQDALNQLTVIFNSPLQGIGKTKANACLTLLDHSFYKPPFLKTKTFIITLQTASCLFTAAEKIKATDDSDGLYQLYQNYWSDVSGHQLKLEHYYASQQRVGGEFFLRYFQKNQTYNPQWLTSAGSVFVLTSTENSDQKTISDLLNSWQLQGLPILSTMSKNWRENPFIKENGFGEICINDSIHQQFSPEKLGLKGEYL